MDDNVRFIGFTDEELRDKVNVEGMDAIHIDCGFNIGIFSLLMKLGAEVRFKARRNLNYVIKETKPSSVSICTYDSDGNPHFDTTLHDNDTNLNLIVGHKQFAIIGVSGSIPILTEVLLQGDMLGTWTIYLEGLPVSFMAGSMEEAMLRRAGIFGPKPIKLKREASIKIPDGKTPWNELPSVPCYLNADGYVCVRFGSLPEHTRQYFYEKGK